MAPAMARERSLTQASLDNALRAPRGKFQQVRSTWRRLLQPELGVELLELIRGDAGEGGNMLEGSDRGDGRLLVSQRLGEGGPETLPLRLASDEGRGLDGRNEVLGLLAEHAPARQLPEVARLQRLHGADYFHLSGVVGSLGELPGAEHRVEVAEIAGRGHRGFLRIETLVHPTVDAEAIATRRRRHELPEAFGPRPRNGHRVESALDHGCEHEVLGQSLAAQDTLAHLGISTRTSEPALDEGPPIPRLVLLEEASDLGIVPYEQGRRGGLGSRFVE